MGGCWGRDSSGSQFLYNILATVMRWGLPCQSVIRVWHLVGLCGVDTTGEMACCRPGTVRFWCWDQTPVGAGGSSVYNWCSPWRVHYPGVRFPP